MVSGLGDIIIVLFHTQMHGVATELTRRVYCNVRYLGLNLHPFDMNGVVKITSQRP